MKLFIEHMIYIWIAMMPFCTLYLGIKVLKIKPKYIALLLLTNLIPSVLYWLMIGDIILAIYQTLPFISCFIWVWTDEILRKRKITICYNAVFRYERSKVYIMFPDFSMLSASADTRVGAIKIAENLLIETLQGKKRLDMPDKTPRERIKIWEDTEIVEIEVVMEVKNDFLKAQTEYERDHYESS